MRPESESVRLTSRPGTRLLTLLAIPALLAGAAVIATAAPASAAVVTNAVQDVVITPTNPAQGSQLRTDIKWCVPNGSRAGDTFTLQLDPHMRRLPEGFRLDDPATGVEVASAAITGTTPDAAIVTFTLTAYAESHTGVCGTAFVSADFDGFSTPSGQPTPFTSVTNDGKTFTTVITPTGPVPADLTQPSKYGTWTNDDQGQTDPTDFIEWNIDTPNGAFDSATTVDRVPAGERWTFDCSADSVHLYDGFVDAQGDYQQTTEVTGPVTYTCADDVISVDWPAQQAGERFRLRVSASMPTPFGSDDAPATFSNDAAITTTTANVPTTFETSASLTQATSGGEGAGTAIPPVTTPPTEQPTPTQTPTPVVIQPAAGAVPIAATPIAATPRATNSDAALAYTGSDDTVGLWAGGGMLALGLVLALLARRRRTTTGS